MSIFEELKRRNVFRVAVAYVVAAWVIIEVSSLILDIYQSPDSVIRIIVALLALGLPFAMVFAWAFEVTPAGIRRETEIDRAQSITGHTAQRLDVLTIGLVVVAVIVFAADRFLLQQIYTASVPDAQNVRDGGAADTSRDALWATQQLLEIDRLQDLGDFAGAFALASDVEPLLNEDFDAEAFWAEFSWSMDIDSEPQGANVYRQHVSSDGDEWEELGTTPLNSVRFPEGEFYRVRFELPGHRGVVLLNKALLGADYRGIAAINPVQLDLVDELPEEMVRIAGFTENLVDYNNYLMDRFEVTNRDYARFVADGGYETQKYWTHAFTKDGDEVPWQAAVATFVDRTGRPGPATWSGGAYPTDNGDYPVGGVGWYEAAAYANFVDKELPTESHQWWAHRFYREHSGVIMPRSNFRGDGPWPIGANRAMTSMGIYDLTGNVREWSWNKMGDDERGTIGGAWTDPPYLATYLVPKSPWDRDPTHGFRLVRTFDGEEKLARLRQPLPPYEYRDYRKEEPASDTEFAIYRSMYAYDPVPLNAEIVGTDKLEHWTRERAEFDLPSGERGAALIYIPANAKPPYETIVYWPGANALTAKIVDDHTLRYFDFLIRSGRAVAKPIFKGTYDRDDAKPEVTPATVWPAGRDGMGTRHRDQMINWVQELSRTIDYLETRDDIQADNLGYSGFSWGGSAAPMILAIENQRIKAAVLNVGGLDDYYEFLPEVDGFNFLPRVTTPVLMINGEFDTDFAFDTAQKPMFDNLGTDPKDKKMYVAPAAHQVPHDIVIRETLDWFDHYLSGKPRRD